MVQSADIIRRRKWSKIIYHDLQAYRRFLKLSVFGKTRNESQDVEAEEVIQFGALAGLKKIKRNPAPADVNAPHKEQEQVDDSKSPPPHSKNDQLIPTDTDY
jgi:hypothetical protein